jgi:hypothetical protein
MDAPATPPTELDMLMVRLQGLAAELARGGAIAHAGTVASAMLAIQVLHERANPPARPAPPPELAVVP